MFWKIVCIIIAFIFVNSGGGNDETLVDESEDVDEEVTFKKPPMPNRRRSKGTLNITVVRINFLSFSNQIEKT